MKLRKINFLPFFITPQERGLNMRVITSESVFSGHPDKICDTISDAILDEILREDKFARVAVVCCIKDNLVVIFGEVTTTANVDYKSVALDVLRDIGYNDEFTVIEKISKQSSDIAIGVDETNLHEQGAGDQGMMYGYACNETPELMPIPIMCAHEIARRIDYFRKTKYPHMLGPDGKCQVSISYVDGKPSAIETIVVSAQTKPGVELDVVKEIITKEVLNELFGDLTNIKVLINPTGSFVVGGPYGDSGLTGRKIIVDTYGGYAKHGGGAFSGKDVSKVDRSASYYARYVAKSIVEADLAEHCEVCIAYSIGIAEPVSVYVNTFNTGIMNDDVLLELIKQYFDFTPAKIKNELELDKVKFRSLACYGHMGRVDLNVRWEHVEEKAEEIRRAYEEA